MLPANVIVARSAASLQRSVATKKWTNSSSRYASLANTMTFGYGHENEKPTKHHFHTVSHASIFQQSFSSSEIYSGNATTTTIPIRQRTKMVPRKAAMALTPKARELFKKLIAATDSEGIILKYQMSTQHALRMAFKFDLIKDAKNELTDQDEGVSLEVLEDGVTPKPPSQSWDDNLPKLYIHHEGFMKVLGGTLDVEFNPETGDLTPKLFNREGHEMDPNA